MDEMITNPPYEGGDEASDVGTAGAWARERSVSSPGSTETEQQRPSSAAPSVLVAIDPGLDAVGVAVYRVPQANDAGVTRLADVVALGRELLLVQTIRTQAAEAIGTRLQRIDTALRALLSNYQVMHMVIEMPAIVGTYQRNRAAVGRDGMAAGMSKLWLAVGVIFSTGLRIASSTRFVEAVRQRKQDRQMLSTAIFKVSPAAESHPARLPSGDALDAVWLGAQQLELLRPVNQPPRPRSPQT